MIKATNGRNFMPFLTNSAVKASSKGGLEGGFESRKSSTGSTMPRPMRWNQTRLAMFLANCGLSRVSQSAKSSSAFGSLAKSGAGPAGGFGSIIKPDRGCTIRGLPDRNTTSSPVISCLSNLSC